MPYTATKPSLFGSVGGPNPPTGGTDVAGLVDALSGTAQSLIHSAMLRKQTERQNQLETEDRELRRKSIDNEQAWREKESARQDREDRRKFMLEGGVPEHDEMEPTPTTAAVPAPVSPFRRAMTPRPSAPATSTGLPPASFTPAGAPEQPATAPLPASNLTQTTIPEHVDVTQGATYQRAVDVANVRGQITAEQAAAKRQEQEKLQAQRIDAGKQAATVAQQGRMAIAKWYTDHRASGIRGALTANGAVGIADKTAEGLLVKFGGDRQAAYEWLQSDDPDAKGLREMESKLPVSWGTFLDNASARATNKGTAQALSFQHGLGGDSPEEAKARVDATKKLVSSGGGTRIGRTTTPPKGAESLAPDSPLDLNSMLPSKTAAPAKGSAPRVGNTAPTTPKTDNTKTGKAAADSVDASFSDDELDEALAAGKESPADVRAFILTKRKSKGTNGKRAPTSK